VPQVVKRFRVGRADEQGSFARLVRHEVAQGPAELRARPALELQRLQALVVSRLVDGVVFAGQVVRRQAPGDGLLIERIGLGQGVQFVGLRLRLGAEHMLYACDVEQIADLGGVDEQRRRQYALQAGVQVLRVDGADAIAVGFGAHEPVAAQHGHPPGGHMRLEQFVDRFHGDPGLMA
jgi:hypothetical protein